LNEEPNDLDGLWGWLLLFTGWVVLKIAGIGFLLASAFLPLFRDGTWQALTRHDSPAYHPLWERVLLFELAGNIAIGALAMVTLALLVVRSAYAPRSAIALLVGTFAVAAVSYSMARQIPSVVGTDYDSLALLVRSTLAMLVWVPYFLVSRRVKATFSGSPFATESSS
jgi:MFS superfamily sulfate permease-like transporter